MPNYNFNFNGKKKGIEWSIMAGITGGVLVGKREKYYKCIS